MAEKREEKVEIRPAMHENPILKIHLQIRCQSYQILWPEIRVKIASSVAEIAASDLVGLKPNDDQKCFHIERLYRNAYATVSYLSFYIES